MRTLGLLGGMSWESSIVYERVINEKVRERLGGVHSADLLIRSYDFARIEAMQVAGQWGAAGRLLASDAVSLQDAGAEGIVLCTNTMHLVADAIEDALDVPFLHIADPVIAAAGVASLDTVALLGTRFTMESTFLVERLTHGGLNVLVPAAPDRATVDGVIYAELVRGVFSEQSRAAVAHVAERLVAQGASGVVAGCTEIELLLRPQDVSVPLLATSQLHAEAAAAFVLGEV